MLSETEVYMNVITSGQCLKTLMNKPFFVTDLAKFAKLKNEN